jgi:hypothetical protein
MTVPGRGLHSFPLPLNLSLLCPFPLNLSLLCPPHDSNLLVDVSRIVPKLISNVSHVFPKVLKLSFEVSGCTPRVTGRSNNLKPRVKRARLTGRWQGLTIVHFSAQRERFEWQKGYINGLIGGCLGGIRG